MKRSEKIDLIKSGKYIIENDMIGSEEVNKLLKSINEFLDWTNGWNFYGINSIDNFNALFKCELNNRPRFKMSELVEVGEPTYINEMFSDSNLRLAMDIAFKKAGHNAYFGNGFMLGAQFVLENLKPTEPKEVFTTEFIRSIEVNLSYENIATKLNQMAFDAYKTK